MNKEECRLQLYRAADLFEASFANRNLLLLYKEKGKSAAGMEVAFQGNNYLHLTGVVLTDKKITADEFYLRCVDRRLGLDQFELKNDGTTEMKMKVLPVMLDRTDLSAKMLGDFEGQRILLVTHRLVGGIQGSMGFLEIGDYYRPNTVLKDDIRDIVDSAKRVLAVYRKDTGDPEYKEQVYLAKRVVLAEYRLPKEYEYLLKTDSE